VYVARQRRVAYLRALSATLANRVSRAAVLLTQIPSSATPSSTSVLASAVAGYIDAKQGRAARIRPADPVASIDPSTARECQYWIAAAALARGDTHAALAAATTGLEQAVKIGSDELAWRFAAIGSAAARGEADEPQRRALRTTAAARLARLRASWGNPSRLYEQRPDLNDLRKAVELED
jgi:hypothetical protein